MRAAERGVFLSEMSIRRAIGRLEGREMVRVFPGKGGTVITDKGRLALREPGASGINGETR